MGNVRWVKCKGCGLNVMLFLEDCPPYYFKGAVGHEKVSGAIRCSLRKSMTVEEFFKLHEDAEPSERQPATWKTLEN